MKWKIWVLKSFSPSRRKRGWVDLISIKVGQSFIISNNGAHWAYCIIPTTKSKSKSNWLVPLIRLKSLFGKSFFNKRWVEFEPSTAALWSALSYLLNALHGVSGKCFNNFSIILVANSSNIFESQIYRLFEPQVKKKIDIPSLYIAQLAKLLSGICLSFISDKFFRHFLAFQSNAKKSKIWNLKR